MTTSKEWFDRDFYADLGVDSDANTKEITKAYRALAKKYHPDANSDQKTEEKFKEITEAYEVLGDEEKRKEYDYIRAMITQGGSPGGFGFQGYQAYSEPTAGQTEDLSDLLSGLFSRMRKPSRSDGASSGFPGSSQAQQSGYSAPNFDIETVVGITFYQALEGTVVPITYSVPGQDSKEIKVKIPAGVNDGQRIKVSGKGNMDHKGKRGDLYVKVNVSEHPWFGRKGRTLIVEVPISYPESIVGLNVKVPTLSEPVTIKVPPGTKSGTTMRVKGRGCNISGQIGDLLIKFDIVPTELNDEEKKLFGELIKIQSVNPRQKFGLEKQA